MVVGYSAAQVRAAEAPYLAAGVPLMQRAAAGLAEHVRRLLDETVPAGEPRRVLLLVGSGNNGADALYAGAELAAEGAAVEALAIGSRIHESSRQAALGAGVRMIPANELDAPTIRRLAAVDIVVDGIVGTGASADPALRGLARTVVLALLPVVAPADSRAGTPPGDGLAGARTAVRHPLVVAVDIPSGIHPDDGSAPDAAVLPAHTTVTFGGVKAGLLLGRGAELAGDVRLVPIGIEADLACMPPVLELP
jgi:NAD(P)H-hydrate repair Nnr-like enzyme with NAD(P)H-hydrate epimerase domain